MNYHASSIGFLISTVTPVSRKVLSGIGRAGGSLNRISRIASDRYEWSHPKLTKCNPTTSTNESWRLLIKLPLPKFLRVKNGAQVKMRVVIRKEIPFLD